MVSEKIRKVRKSLERKKQAAAESRERARFKKQLKKSKIRESGPVQEAKATKRELGKLGREVSGPAKRVGENVSAFGRRAQSAVERLDDRFGDVPARDEFGMAGDDFDIDLEVVDDFERGMPEKGMGDAGFDVVFEDEDEGSGLLGELDSDDLEVVGEGGR